MTEFNPLTTGQVARYCRVSRGSILNWIRQGKLKAYATPGGHFRVLASDLLPFLDAHGMPVDEEIMQSLQGGT
jgi:excisionase family DNA binding protein